MLPMPNLLYIFPQSRPLQPPSCLLQRLHQNHFTPKMFNLYTRCCLENWVSLILSIAKNKTHQNVVELFCAPSEELKPTETITLDKKLQLLQIHLGTGTEVNFLRFSTVV